VACYNETMFETEIRTLLRLAGSHTGPEHDAIVVAVGVLERARSSNEAETREFWTLTAQSVRDAPDETSAVEIIAAVWLQARIEGAVSAKYQC
jgi:hypothetical protein